ncbi:hypothetical protein, partial [Dongia sp.]|uniref:hypothetical protein n=1 Tax=Dongia sp. TaxID=1977262 RepID=UPI0035AE3A84
MSKPPKEPSILGTWRGDRFDFASPAAREAWHRSAYGQAVDPETWHLGDPVDPETERAIGLGIGGAQPPAYRGPDGQSRFGNSRTLERADLRAIRQRAFAGKSIEEIEDAYDTGTLLPGEEEAVHLLLGTPQARKRPPAITPAPVAQTDYANPESAMRSLFGMDPDAPRPNILPDPRGADGEFTSDVSQWTAPQLLYDLAKAFVTPRVAIEGGKVSDADALNLALSTAGGGVAKTASHGAIGMPQVAESLASRQAKLYDGPQVQRPFSKDYPDGYRTDAAGNLTHDIDGNPLEIGNR